MDGNEIPQRMAYGGRKSSQSMEKNNLKTKKIQ